MKNTKGNNMIDQSRLNLCAREFTQFLMDIPTMHHEAIKRRVYLTDLYYMIFEEMDTEEIRPFLRMLYRDLLADGELPDVPDMDYPF